MQLVVYVRASVTPTSQILLSLPKEVASRLDFYVSFRFLCSICCCV
jgi:hypothetical protein